MDPLFVFVILSICHGLISSKFFKNFLSDFWFKHIIRQFTIPHPHIKLRTREFRARIILNPNIRGSNIKIKDSKQNSIQLLSSNNLILTWTAQFLNFKEGTTVPDSF